jgi:DNA-binding NtrC family response regulator
VAKGEFREDLYYRLNVVKINLPSLKEKIDDIPLLVHHFIEQFNKKFKRNISSISSRAIGYVVSYDWPGNVRQLENAIEHAFICAKGKIILPQDLPPEIRQGEKKKESASIGDNIDLEQGKREILTLDEMEAHMIVNVLHQTEGHLGNTAQILGIARSTLWRLMKKHNITKEPGRNKKVIFLKEKFTSSQDHGHNAT